MTMGEARLGPETRVRQNPAVLSAEVGDAIVLLHAEQNAYYDMDSVGARVWRELTQPADVATICKILEQEYEVDPTTCQADVLAFLENALNEGIIEIDPR